MGNSEVGHNALGAGRIYVQGLISFPYFQSSMTFYFPHYVLIFVTSFITYLLLFTWFLIWFKSSNFYFYILCTIVDCVLMSGICHDKISPIGLLFMCQTEFSLHLQHLVI